MHKTFWYRVNVPSEKSAGIIGFTDTVSITVVSGDAGGEKDGEYSFQEEMRKALCDWYDGGRIEYVEGDCSCIKSKYEPYDILFNTKNCPIHGIQHSK